MLFRFNIGKSRSGSIRAAGIPVYYMPHWRVVGGNERAYTSLDEMPAEIRAAYREVLKRSGRRQA
jgi:hypothetical protein